MLKTHDGTTNATYYLLEPMSNRKVAKTKVVSDICNVDIDANGYPIGIEVLHPARLDQDNK